MTILLTDGFELSDSKTFNFSRWSGSDIRGTPSNTVTYSSSNKHHGSYCMKSTKLDDNSGVAGYAEEYYITTQNPVYLRAYVLFDNLCSNANQSRVLAVNNSLGAYAVCYFGQNNNGGTGQWWLSARHNVAFSTYTGPNCNINQMYCIELGVFVDGVGGTGWCKAWVDGKLIINATNLTSDRAIGAVGIGHNFSGASTVDVSAYVDCVIVSTGYVGPEQPRWSSRRRQQLRAQRGKSGRVGRLYLR